VTDDSRRDALLMLNHSTSNHSYRATHSTIRGYNSAGFLRFICCFRADPAFDEARIYQVGWGRTNGRTNAKVWTTLLKEELGEDFS